MYGLWFVEGLSALLVEGIVESDDEVFIRGGARYVTLANAMCKMKIGTGTQNPYA